MSQSYVTRLQRHPSAPLYDPAFEHDACGTGFVADLSGTRSHAIVRRALEAVVNLTHRGAVDADAKTGDGAGIMLQTPGRLLAREATEMTGRQIDESTVAAGMIFTSPKPRQAALARSLVSNALGSVGVEVLGWRNVPVRPEVLGQKALATMPGIWQVLFTRPAVDDPAFERSLYVARRKAERAASENGIRDFHIASLSSRTLVYKGLFVARDLEAFYEDLSDPNTQTALAVFHQRYSTNTFPTWALAQPFRRIAHNGEINTLQGNRNWMHAREPELAGAGWTTDLSEVTPVIDPDGSDSLSLDNVLELIDLSGRDLLHAIAMLVPEPWENMPGLSEEQRAFHAWHAPLMEPWDGPATIAFSDGRIAGAVLDRNGLRPARYTVTREGLVVLASETGVLDLTGYEVIERGRLGPGQMLAVDTTTGQLWHDDEIKAMLSSRRPWKQWVDEQLQELTPLPDAVPEPTPVDLHDAQIAFGFTAEDQRLVVQPMAVEGKEPLWSMGDDAPLAVLSAFPRPLAAFFRQRFAQVTNPPIDPLREAVVMSLDCYLGPRGNLLDEAPHPAGLFHLRSPILTDADLAALRAAGAVTLDATFAASDASLQAALEALTAQAIAAVDAGAGLLILSDRGITPERVPIPMPLAVGALHHSLLQAGKRMRASLICDTGDIWDVHQAAVLAGYGATAFCPWLALRTAGGLAGGRGLETTAPDELEGRYKKSLEAGLLKVMSKMGISALASYTGGQLFEIIGLDESVVERCFNGTPSRLGGLTLADIQQRVLARHADRATAGSKLSDYGLVRYRRDGEHHAYSPAVAKALQQATNGGSAADYQAFVDLASDHAPATVRDLLTFRPSMPIPVDEVEPVEEIRRRFVITAMSLGALSPEAYRTLAIAMNRIGGRSNSGEGGEDPDWYYEPGSDVAYSRVKQIASARFGVTAEYLGRATEIEIKMAQGSKPGEGGQLPAHKVTPLIARLRHAVPGVSLISPPPHHDIYSIEDLAQLIYDLKQVNPAARIGVKLVAEAGVGTVAAGVAKAHADYILISGHSGGTGASPLSSIKHVGVPWEIGLAEAQQTLVINGLRDRVRLRTDGGLQTGRDVVIAAMIGAEEFGFGTAALVSIGCDMARQCHLNTCPTGIATQREDLRAKFAGTPEQVIAYVTSLAAEVRQILANLGVRRLDDIIGRVDLLDQVRGLTGPASTLDLSALLNVPGEHGAPLRSMTERNTAATGGESLDNQLVADVLPAIAERRPVSIDATVRNHHRSIGAWIAGEIAARHSRDPLPSGTIQLCLNGIAGQSFGAWCTNGMRLVLNGQANDYVGKGMSGGEIVIRQAERTDSGDRPDVVLGNTSLYGATGGELYAAGQAGERFAVRNSGATAVVEGVGDHGCEYMTGGIVVVLGPTGRNFAAGMTNGTAYVLDLAEAFQQRCHLDLVELQRVTDQPDADALRALIERHALLTGSAQAWDVLAQWEILLPRFWKVVPRTQPDLSASEPAPRRRARPVEMRTAAAAEPAAG